MKLEVKNAKFFYKNDEILFKDLSFSLDSGEILAIMGPNGVGKTSLIRAICGFEKFKEGGAFLDGKNIESFDKKGFWNKISYIPQKREATFA